MVDERWSPQEEQHEVQNAMLAATRQCFIEIDKEEWKFETLCDLYEAVTITKGVVYCNTRERVEWVSEHMRAKGQTVSTVHGEMEEAERAMSFAVALQIARVLINYDMPTQVESYIDRFAPYYRFGRRDIMVNFVLPSEMSMLRQIEQFYHTEIPELPMNVDEFFW
ncbi:unnamed protein product [Aphanomyces euteiches]|uniref:Helicase C-terminal domain-containing protein n=1 Tax=Aphanomyces euteiches TaxID=100861 RepID=A0A6G0XN35_9STRA|nr:hypothetical protein Ae201684_003074 [Aphanomyces euteiches]KAH9098407.1 hypothetical protein Ae201684P_017620 [Aphanomyces euteiches]KAH9139710.1 hypothetical protein AeRB84_016014 [Aphanomyces euteiches]